MSVAKLAKQSTYDPALLAGLRDFLASTFATKIRTSLPEVNEFIEFESELAVDASAKQALAKAAHLLFSRHAAIEAQLVTTIAASFDAIVDPVAARSRRTRIQVSSLRLVDDVQMAGEVALIDCARRLKEQSDYELFELSRGIALLAGREHLTDESNPVFPRVFANALMQALDTIKCDPTAMLVMFKAFGPMLLDILPATYRAGTAWLKQHAVELDAYVFRPAVAVERPAPVTHTPLVAPTDAALVGPLINVRRSTQADTAQTGRNTATSSSTALTTHSAEAEIAEAPQQLLLTERVLLATFDVLNKDMHIPVVLRPVIARLKDSIQKLVSDDAGFLTHSTHPARKFLELLAEAGTIVESNEAAVSMVDAAARIVEDAIRTQMEAPRAYAIAFERLDALIAAQEAIALDINPEIRTLLQSELRECAHDAANEAIGARLDGRKLPPEVTAFVLITWRAVLVADYLHGGVDGQAWKLGVATLEELLRSIEPTAKIEDRAERAASLSSLVELIRDGIEHAQLHPLLADDFLGGLQTLHLRAMQRKRDTSLDGLEPLSFPRDANHGSAPARVAAESLAAMGLIRGSFVELRESGEPQRWRLCWISPFRGHCVLKQYESHISKVVKFDALLAAIASQDAKVVDGMGLVGKAISTAFKLVNQNAPQRAPQSPALRLVATDPQRRTA